MLVLLTLVWGLNWPVMKIGVSGTAAQPLAFPPLTFRALSMLLGLPVLAGAMLLLKIPLRLPRAHWGETLRLTLSNLVVWHIIVIVAVQHLSSGRAAILGYSMPIFAALWAVLLFGERFTLRQGIGVLASGVGILLLLAHEFGKLSGAPLAAGAVLFAACVWAYGTHKLRRSTLPVHVLTIVFWMTTITAGVVSVLALLLEPARWIAPQPHVSWAIAYNAVAVFGFAHAAWFYLARSMPPVASSISVMMIPVLGTFRGAWLLNEALHWQDFAAMALMVVAIAAVLLRPAAGAAVVTSASGAAGRWYGSLKPKAAQDLGLARFHRRGLVVGLVVVALRVQRAVHQQVRVVRLQRDAQRLRLAARPPARTGSGRPPPRARARSRRSARWWRSPCCR